MDFLIECDFVKKCIKKDYQERIMFELQSKKHREKAIARFSHFPEIIVKDLFAKCTINDLNNYFGKINSTEKCYIISGNLYDGEEILLKDAIQYFKESFMTVILITSKYAVIKEEVETGSPIVWIGNL